MKKRKKRRGRPEYIPTKVVRDKVAKAAGGGTAHEDIALALGISRNTLEKHFERELSFGAAAKRLEATIALFDAAKKGKVAAIKAYLANDPKVAPPPAPKPEAQGKKEQQQVAATTAQHGTDWESDLRPRGTPLN